MANLGNLLKGKKDYVEFIKGESNIEINKLRIEYFLSQLDQNKAKIIRINPIFLNEGGESYFASDHYYGEHDGTSPIFSTLSFMIHYKCKRKVIYSESKELKEKILYIEYPALKEAKDKKEK
jgi:hypothetical protein